MSHDDELARIELSGRSLRAMATEGSVAEASGVVGVDVAERTVDDAIYTVVQVLFDDDRPGFDHGQLDGPLLAEVLDTHGAVVGREPFDHDQFRRTLHDEQQAGTSVTRGVLVRNDGELPPPWVRLAFLPLAVTATAGATLVVRRTSADELRAGVEQAYAHGEIGDDERLAVLTSIDQRHPR
jgi:hypothetical protein